jgi:hypothetical protein
MRVRGIFFAVLVVGVFACRPTAPTSVSRVVIHPSTDALKLSEQKQFGASLNERPVDASWMSSDPTVLSVEASGWATGLRLGTAALTATTQGQKESYELLDVRRASGWFTFMAVFATM